MQPVFMLKVWLFLNVMLVWLQEAIWWIFNAQFCCEWPHPWLSTGTAVRRGWATPPLSRAEKFTRAFSTKGIKSSYLSISLIWEALIKDNAASAILHSRGWSRSNRNSGIPMKSLTYTYFDWLIFVQSQSLSLLHTKRLFPERHIFCRVDWPESAVNPESFYLFYTHFKHSTYRMSGKEVHELSIKPITCFAFNKGRNRKSNSLQFEKLRTHFWGRALA